MKQKALLLLSLVLSLTGHSFQLDLDFCHEELGVSEGGVLPESALSASSSYDEASVGPQNARLRADTNGGAWCPALPVSRDRTDGGEWLQVDLGGMHVITAVLTQGRFGNGRGVEYAETYKLQYWRPGMTDFIQYQDNLGRTILSGNSNTYSVANTTLNPAIFAWKLRFVPYSDHPRTVCLRVELVGCPFTEGVVSYSIPQGMVRGSILELMDHTFDGHEDPQSGDLRGGLGQLVDGRYGWDNFKATGVNGHVKGYDWLGWKKKTATLNLVFAFDGVRTFQRVDIHANNHFTKDIQIFKQAKVYFSNEEDKFGDDRVVDFKYMPDLAIENARNVSINLKGEHGQFVMLQLYFAAKWILISEVTFISEPRREKPFVVSPPMDEQKREEATPTVTNDDDEDTNSKLALEPKKVEEEEDMIDIDVEIDVTAQNAEDQQVVGGPKATVGVVIGILLTVISLLLVGILCVVYRSKRAGKRATPTHSLLVDYKGHAHTMMQYTPYTSTAGHTQQQQQKLDSYEETIYEEPINSRNNFFDPALLSSVDPALLSDCTDEYAEPGVIIGASNSYSENIYAQATPGLSNNKKKGVALPPLPLSHYARPMSPPNNSSSIDPLQSLVLPPPPPNAASMVVSGGTTSATSSLGASTNNHRSPPPEIKSLLRRGSSLATPLSSSSSSNSTKSRNNNNNSSSGKSKRGSTSKKSSRTSTATKRQQQQTGKATAADYYASNDVISAVDLAKLYAQVNKSTADSGGVIVQPFKRSTSIDTVNVTLNEMDRTAIVVVDKLGEGQFGEIHLCRLDRTDKALGLPEDMATDLVAVKSLRHNCDATSRSDFEHEARILTSLNDDNLVRVLGVCYDKEHTLPVCMVCEYTDEGDLCQFLQDHVAETTLSKSPNVPTLSYGCLIYLAAQIASGMKYLESLNFVHRDLAARNCLVGPKCRVKICDFGMSRPMYKNDYYKTESGCLLPIRWMAWESLLMGKFTTKSDVWSFGVTLWEILTFAREQPYESQSDAKVLSSLSNVWREGRQTITLSTPFGCPREVRDLMAECWQRDENERPSFREIHLFLQRKNLGYNPSNE